MAVHGKADAASVGATARSPRRRRAPVSDRVILGVFIAPSLVVLLSMVAYPFVSLVYYSFLRFSILRPQVPAEAVGFDNYAFLLSDPDLWSRFVFTGRFVFLSVGLQFLLGITIAYILQRDFRGRDVIFTALMLPMMLCPIVVGFLWRYMFNSEWGVVNYLRTLVGLPKLDW